MEVDTLLRIIIYHHGTYVCITFYKRFPVMNIVSYNEIQKFCDRTWESCEITRFGGLP
jgi:hypothetical protein